MEKNKPYIPPYDREPGRKPFKRAFWVAIVFFFAYGGFLIWRNYYAPGAKPPTERKQLSVPQNSTDSSYKK